ncbi:MAG: hypothetical protein LBV68_07005 [Spirochaetaceae bacterium]|jgi:hypothetical protein|nr:hypothetical protein [Spirochaetaceae bacterium]
MWYSNNLKRRSVLTVAVISLLFNFLVFFIILSSHFSSFFFYAGDKDKNFTHAACIVGVQTDAGENEQLFDFGAITLNLKKGYQAYVQFSLLSLKTQNNLMFVYLYEHDILDVKITGAGVTITALKAGDSFLQAFTENGAREIALIHVVD